MAAMLHFFVLAIFCLAVAATVTVQVGTFVQDLVFYRRIGWNLSLDSGNNLLFFDSMKGSPLFGGMPVGFLRLTVGFCFVVFGSLILYAFYLFAFY